MKTLVFLMSAIAAGTGALLAMPVAAQNADSGAATFQRVCGACHTVVAGKTSVMGPNLRGVVGRKAGSTAFAYSPAMKAAGFAWTPDKIDAYLASPRKVVPGTRMAYMGMAKPTDRADIVAFLKKNAR